MTVSDPNHPAHLAGKRSRDAVAARDKEAFNVPGLARLPEAVTNDPGQVGDNNDPIEGAHVSG